MNECVVTKLAQEGSPPLTITRQPRRKRATFAISESSREGGNGVRWPIGLVRFLSSPQICRRRAVFASAAVAVRQCVIAS